MKAGVSAHRGRRPARCGRALASPRRRSRGAQYTLEQLRRGARRPEPDLRSWSQVHKARRHVTRRRARWRSSAGSSPPRRAPGRPSPSSPRIPSASTLRVPSSASTGGANVNVPRGLKAMAGFDARRFAVLDVGTNSVKFHVGDRGRTARWRRRASTAPRSRGSARVSPTRGARARRRWSARWRRSPGGVAGAHELGAAEPSPPSPPPACAMAANGPGFVAGRPASLRPASGLERIAAEEEARLAYVAATSALARGRSPAGVRHGRRQLPVHLRHPASAPASASASTSARPASPSSSDWPASSTDATLAAGGSPGSRPSSPRSRPPAAGRDAGLGGAVNDLGRRRARPRRIRPGRRARGLARRARRSTGKSSSIAPCRPTSAAPSRAPAGPGPVILPGADRPDGARPAGTVAYRRATAACGTACSPRSRRLTQLASDARCTRSSSTSTS